MATNKNTKKPTKSRTAQTGLKKKVGIPKWAIFATVLVVAGIGIALVYNSFAGTSQTIYCKQGVCKLYKFSGSVPDYKPVRYASPNSNCLEQRYIGNKFQYLPSAKLGWRCLAP